MLNVRFDQFQTLGAASTWLVSLTLGQYLRIVIFKKFNGYMGVDSAFLILSASLKGIITYFVLAVKANG